VVGSAFISVQIAERPSDLDVDATEEKYPWAELAIVSPTGRVALVRKERLALIPV
jgi:hypothetical protein